MKKYEVTIHKDQTVEFWWAILVCHCGQSPEQTRVEARDFGELLDAIGDKLVKHENHES